LKEFSKFEVLLSNLLIKEKKINTKTLTNIIIIVG
jgi:hypothetical protein